MKLRTLPLLLLAALPLAAQDAAIGLKVHGLVPCLLYTSPSPRD